MKIPIIFITKQFCVLEIIRILICAEILIRLNKNPIIVYHTFIYPPVKINVKTKNLLYLYYAIFIVLCFIKYHKKQAIA